MPNLRRFVSLIALLLAASAALAQHEHHQMTLDDWRAFVNARAQHGEMIPQPATFSVAPEAAKTVNITASCSGTNFSFSPNTFNVNQNDVVTVNVTVPSNDCSPVGHGLLMSQYIEDGVNVSKGRTVSRTFTATTVGQFPFVCTQSLCGLGHSNMFGVMNVVAAAPPAPAISSITPTSGPTSGGTQVTISGSAFESGSTVTFGGTPATNIMFVNGTLVVTAPAHAAGAVEVKVTNPDSQSGTLANGFTYLAPPPLSVANVYPNFGTPAGGTVITISGSGFQGSPSVTFGGTAATSITIVDAQTLRATTPAHTAGAVPVVVKQGSDTITVPNGYTYTTASPRRHSAKH